VRDHPERPVPTSSVDRVVDSSKRFDSALDHVVNLLYARNVRFHSEDLSFAFPNCIDDELLRSFETLLVSICEYYLCASFASEGDCRSLAYACLPSAGAMGL
jgi:hypothetical protein